MWIHLSTQTRKCKRHTDWDGGVADVCRSVGSPLPITRLQPSVTFWLAKDFFSTAASVSCHHIQWINRNTSDIILTRHAMSRAFFLLPDCMTTMYNDLFFHYLCGTIPTSTICTFLTALPTSPILQSGFLSTSIIGSHQYLLFTYSITTFVPWSNKIANNRHYFCVRGDKLLCGAGDRTDCITCREMGESNSSW